MRAGRARSTRRCGPTTVTRHVSAPPVVLLMSVPPAGGPFCAPPARLSCRSLGRVVGNSMRVAPTRMERFPRRGGADRAAVARPEVSRKASVSTVIVRRRERREGPALPYGEIGLEPPPEIPEVAGDGFGQMLTYLPMLAMTFGMVAMMSGTGSGALRWVG